MTELQRDDFFDEWKIVGAGMSEDCFGIQCPKCYDVTELDLGTTISEARTIAHRHNIQITKMDTRKHR